MNILMILSSAWPKVCLMLGCFKWEEMYKHTKIKFGAWWMFCTEADETHESQPWYRVRNTLLSGAGNRSKDRRSRSSWGVRRRRYMEEWERMRPEGGEKPGTSGGGGPVGVGVKKSHAFAILIFYLRMRAFRRKTNEEMACILIELSCVWTVLFISTK